MLRIEKVPQWCPSRESQWRQEIVGGQDFDGAYLAMR